MRSPWGDSLSPQLKDPKCPLRRKEEGRLPALPGHPSPTGSAAVDPEAEKLLFGELGTHSPSPSSCQTRLLRTAWGRACPPATCTPTPCTLSPHQAGPLPPECNPLPGHVWPGAPICWGSMRSNATRTLSSPDRSLGAGAGPTVPCSSSQPSSGRLPVGQAGREARTPLLSGLQLHACVLPLHPHPPPRPTRRLLLHSGPCAPQVLSWPPPDFRGPVGSAEASRRSGLAGSPQGQPPCGVSLELVASSSGRISH